MTYNITFQPDDNGKIYDSTNDHYSLYVVERAEADHPGEKLPRYEIVNKSTLAVEGRVANLQMAYLVMQEFDRRLEELMVSGVDEEEVVGVPLEMDLGGSSH